MKKIFFCLIVLLCHVTANAQQVQVDPFTGTSNVSIPIQIPPGRAGIQPNISLSYNSNSPDGFLGVGWSLNTQSIVKFSNTFYLKNGISAQELIDISGTGTSYRPKIESAFNRIDFLNGSWVMTDKKGMKSFLGSVANSQVTDSGNNIVEWKLDRVEDVNSNYMTLTYNNSKNIDRIDYTGNSSQSSPTFASTFFVYTNNRLSKIYSTVSGINFYEYNIAYIQAPNGEYLLKSIDPAAAGLPTTIFSYTQPASQLTKIDNSVGGTTELVYSKIVLAGAPSDIYVVDQSTAKTAQGDSYTTRYLYTGGVWVGGEFRTGADYGFASVKIIDADGNYTKTNFLQDDTFKGRASDQSSYSAAGSLFAKTINYWGSQAINAGVKFVCLLRTDNLIYDGNSTGRRTAEEYVYGESPQYGNMTKMIQYGEVALSTGIDLGSDTRTVETVYGNNVSANLIGFPQTIIVRDNSGAAVRQSWFYYDGATLSATLPTKGLLTQKTNWGGGTSPNPITKFNYDGYGNLISTTDPNTNTTTIDYDPQYHTFPTSTTNALNQMTTNEYYGVNGVPLSSGGFSGLWGQLKSTTDANNQKTLNSYDTAGRNVFLVDPPDSVTYPTRTADYVITSGYTRVSAKQRITSGQSDTRDTYQFIDGLGRVMHTRSPADTLGKFIISGQTTYTSRGLPSKKYIPFFSTNNQVNVIDPIDPNHASTQMQYDAMGRLIKVINPDGSSTTIGYDDWLTGFIDENGHKQRSYFDAYGRLIKKEEYIGSDGRSSLYPATSPNYTLYATTYYEYDSEGNLTKTTDAKGNITTIVYDKLGRKTSMNDPDMGVWSYTYDLNGNLLTQTDAKGQVITFTYDALNRLKSKTGTGLNSTYTYDDPAVSNSKGQLTQATNSTSNTKFTYDQLGRETKSVKTITPTAYAVERTFNAASELTSVKYPDTTLVSHTLKPSGQVWEAKSGGGNYATNESYNEAGQPTVIFFGNVVMTINTYDPETFRLINIKTTNSAGTIIQNLSYTYDPVGNIVSIVDGKYTASQTFKYDHLNRLIQAVGSYGTKTFSYDTIGNLLTKDGLTYTYGLNGKIPHAVTALSDGTSITYDANGNMATRTKAGVTTTYSYDVENRLKEVKKNGVIQDQFEYDGDGGRTKKITYGTTTTTTKYVGNLYEETGNLQTKHIFLGSQEVASVTKNMTTGISTTVFYHPDHLGGMNIVTNDNGVVKELAEYFPFGGFSRHEKYGSSEEVARFYFTGKKFDEEIGLYFYDGRYYDPGLGRFITADSIVQDPSNPQTFNRYSYCGNNPVNYVDPSGHFFWLAAIAFIAKAAAVVSITTTVAGVITKNETLLDIGRVSGYVGLGAGLTSIAISAATAASSSAASVTAASVDLGTIVIDGANNAARQAAVNAIAAETARGVLREAIVSSVVSAAGAVTSAATTIAYEAAVPGPFGQPVSEWQGGKPTSWGDPVGYTERAGGIVKWLERGYLGVATGATVGAVAYDAALPYWRYVGPESLKNSNWLTRGWKPPYGKNFDLAKSKLQLPYKPDNVLQVKINPFRPVAGPRPVQGNPQWGEGGGSEWWRGIKFPTYGE